MRIRIITGGGRQTGWIREGCQMYAKRLPRELAPEILQIKQARRQHGQRLSTRKRASALLSRVQTNDLLVALDENGRQFTSSALAEQLRSWLASGRRLVIMVGGADGLDSACINRADLLWSLSSLTFPHQLATLLVVEQIYRAWTLLSGHPYHRG